MGQEKIIYGTKDENNHSHTSQGRQLRIDINTNI